MLKRLLALALTLAPAAPVAAANAHFPSTFAAMVERASAQDHDYDGELLLAVNSHIQAVKAMSSPAAVRDYLEFCAAGMGGDPRALSVLPERLAAASLPPSQAAAVLLGEGLTRPAQLHETLTLLRAQSPLFADSKTYLAISQAEEGALVPALRAALEVDENEERDWTAFFDGASAPSFSGGAVAPQAAATRLKRAPSVKVRRADGRVETLSKRQFEREFQVRLVSTLDELPIPPEALAEHAEHQKEVAGWSEPYYWYRRGFARELNSGQTADLSLAKINEQIGYGVFANEAIEPGEWIGEYTGRFLETGEDTRPIWEGNAYLFTFPFGGGFDIDARRAGNITRFINHASKRPNVEFAYVFHKGVYHIVFLAKTRIRPGEQLLFDYGPGYWTKRKPPAELEGP